MSVYGRTQMKARSATIDMTAIGIYLNDHLAGSTAGVELVRRAARSQRGGEAGAGLQRLAVEIAEDRAELIGMMNALGVPLRRYKIFAGWVAEKVGRAKPNGRLLGRSRLSDVVELEGLRLGVEGKAACWRALRILAEGDDRLDPARLEALLVSARGQAETLEELRGRAVARLAGLD